MNRIKTITTKKIDSTIKTGACGKCQTSCQSASKTSCSVINQQCEQDKK